MEGLNNFKIDMVYLWCNGNESEFVKRKSYYASLENGENINESESFGNKRFYDNEELRYSLRSLEQHAPWINHIFIVTDRQVPKWLNTNYERISIIDHSQIMPLSNIPCFNSSVIERYIGFIPGLQEHFLYGNDDTFFGENVSKDFFYENGRPIVRLKYFRNVKKNYTYNELERFDPSDFFEKSVINAWKILSKYNKLKDVPFLEPHHNIDAFTKSDYLNTFFKYKADLDKSISRFRSVNDIQRVLFCADPLINQHAVLRIVKNYPRTKKYLFWIKHLHPESYYVDARWKSLLGLRCIDPILFCINGSGMSKLGNIIERKYLEWKYPHKSLFER